MRITRAEDGETFDANIQLHEIEQRHGSLKAFLNETTGYHADFIISFLTDGRQIRDENLPELSGVEDQSIYVYNREYLEAPSVEEVIDLLAIQPQFQPDVDLDTSRQTIPSILAAYSRAANFHHQHILRISSTLASQTQSLRIASANLDNHVFTINDTFESFSQMAKRVLDNQEEILRGHTLDMEVIARIPVHPDFLSPHVKKAVENGGKERVLGDYVSAGKMAMVAESCARLRQDLSTRFLNTQQSLAELSAAAGELRGSISNAFELEAEPVVLRSQELSERITQAGYDQALQLQDVAEMDKLLRSNVQRITEIKNNSVAHTINILRLVSQLQSDYTTLPPVLINLDLDFRTKAGFPHLQRLHNMLYAYGATLIEITRRKEFAKLFLDRAQIIAEMMAKLSSAERKRRQVYRSEVHGQLPFETKGMDEPPPTLEITTTGSHSRIEDQRGVGRGDVLAFVSMIDELERMLPFDGPTPMSPTAVGDDGSTALISHPPIHPIREMRANLDKLLAKMDNLEGEFDRLAEKSFLSASRLAQSRRRSFTEASAYREAIEQLHEKSEQERLLREERDAMDLELRQLRTEMAEVAPLSKRAQELEQTLNAEREEFEETKSRTSEELKAQVLRGNQLESELRVQREAVGTQRERADNLEEELQTLRDQFTSESAARRSLEARHGALLAEVFSQSKTLETVMADATHHTHAEELLKSELAQAHENLERVQELNKKSDNRVQELLDELAQTLTKLEESRSRGEDLESQIRVARTEGEAASNALHEASSEKERLLRHQAKEADRLLRDHIAEADGDRAVFEQRFNEMTLDLNNKTKEVEEIKAELEVVIIREEQTKKAVSDAGELRRKLSASEQMIESLVTAAMALREAALKASSSAQSFVAASKSNSDSTFMSATLPRSPLSMEVNISRSIEPQSNPNTIVADKVDARTALSALQNFDFDGLWDAINKTGSTIRKWQRQCKDYRERSKGKITFRNFGKGDLALFLPTRNSQAKPWAAFNVSFPHYFLQADPNLSEQLKTREWIVARITSITERVADHKEPETNPYGLGDGVKFYMLEVEDWNQPATPSVPSNSRRHISSSGPRSSRRSTIPERGPTWHPKADSSSVIDSERSLETTSQPPPFASAIRPPSPARRFLETHHISSSRHSGGGASGSLVVNGSNLSGDTHGHNGIPNPDHNVGSALSNSPPPIRSSAMKSPTSPLGGSGTQTNLGEGTGSSPSNTHSASDLPGTHRAPSTRSASSSRPSSVFSPGRVPTFGSPSSSSPGGNTALNSVHKAAATTAISSDISSPPRSVDISSRVRALSMTGEMTTPGDNAVSPVPLGQEEPSDKRGVMELGGDQTPSPAESASEGMSSVLLSGRRRTTSVTTSSTNVTGVTGRTFIPTAVPAIGPSASSPWANLASTLGIGRRKTTTPATTMASITPSPSRVGDVTPTGATNALPDEDGEIGARARAARELLKRYDVGSHHN